MEHKYKVGQLVWFNHKSERKHENHGKTYTISKIEVLYNKTWYTLKEWGIRVEESELDPLDFKRMFNKLEENEEVE